MAYAQAVKKAIWLRKMMLDFLSHDWSDECKICSCKECLIFAALVP